MHIVHRFTSISLVMIITMGFNIRALQHSCIMVEMFIIPSQVDMDFQEAAYMV